MDRRTNAGPLDALLKAVEAGDLERARAAAKILAQGPGHNPMQLAAEVLHELKQPLLGIKGYMQMMAEDEGPHRPVVPLVLAQVERIEQIASDFIRLASNRPAPRQRLALETHVRDAVAAFQRNPDSARVQVDVDLARGLEVNGNPRLIEQLLLNLLNNARDAMGGRGRVKVMTGADAGAVTIVVADWGPGIAPEVRARLFEPYATGRTRGNGLGLAVSRRIAEEHGATLELAPPSTARESPPPATVFRVRFPPEDAAPPRRRILVVDDEAVIRQIFRDLLARECDVVEAETAEAALAKLRAGEAFDLIVTDKNLPGLSGLELAQEARRLDARSKVMVMTGYPSLVTAQQALELGLVDYLLKPFDDIRQVREKIRSVLAAAESARPEAAVGRRVDVYEDDRVSANALCEALAILGLEPRVMHEPVPGADVPPFGVIVSWEFGPAPGKSALELGRRMAQRGPFVVVVERLTLETTLEALRAGCAACLPRLSADPKALARELGRALKR